jgi:PAS domain S-box-containing protein
VTVTKPRVLIVDDSPEDRQTYAHFLSDDHQVLESELGAAGLSAIREYKPDCVLLDYSLPDMTGLEVLDALAKDTSLPAVAVVFLTGYADTAIAVSAMKAGALDFVEKGDVTPVSLKRAIANATEKAHLRAQLDQQRDWLDTTLASITSAIIATDGRGHITVINQAAAEMVGWDLAEARDQPIANVLSMVDEDGDGNWMAALESLLHGNSIASAEARFAWLTSRQGARVPVEYTLTPLNRIRGVAGGAVLVLHDITQHRLIEDSLHQAKEAAEAASRAKTRFLGNMSHELRTPLNAVLGMAQLLEMGGLDPEQTEIVGFIKDGGRTLLNQVSDMLDFSEIDSGQLRLQSEPFRLQAVLAQVRKMASASAQAGNLTIVIEPISGLDRPLIGDALRLGQVLMNLTGNAIKFTPAGGTVTVRAMPLDVGPEEAELHFEVLDTGIGIDANAIKRLFEPFTQADDSVTRRFGGSGLGLSISKHLVESMGGRIGVESEVGKGSRFWFELKLPLGPLSA